MQRYSITSYYKYPVETVAKLLMENETPLYDLVELPNVSTNKILLERWEGRKKYIKVEWCVHGQIPKLAQKVIRPDMLTFVEDSVWDSDKRTYTTKIIPHHFKNQVNAQHKVEFFDNGDGRTRRLISGLFELKIPVVGPLFELAVIQQVKQNAEADFKMSVDALDQYIAKYGDPFAKAK